MTTYRARIDLENADGGTWNETIVFQAEDDDAADTHAREYADSWFQPGREIASGKEVPGAVSVHIALRDVDAEEDVMEYDLEPDGNSSGILYRDQPKKAGV